MSDMIGRLAGASVSYRDKFEAFKVATSAQTIERLLYAGRAHTIGYVNYAGELFERIEEGLRDFS